MTRERNSSNGSDCRDDAIDGQRCNPCTNPCDDIQSVTCTAPVNIAVIKYWGKRNEKLILPINGSLSATLSQEQLCAKTTVAVSSHFKKDQIWLNGCEEDISNNRLQSVIKEIRKRASESYEDGHPNQTVEWKLHICSENNFPTAAGLASSAAGYACLVYSLAKLYKLKGDITDIARLGSGSACRSLDGGFVEWIMGENEDGKDSIAKQIVTEDHCNYHERSTMFLSDDTYRYIRSMNSAFQTRLHYSLQVSGKKKPVGSSAGMQTSVVTSELIQYRAEHVVPKRLTAIKEAIHSKNFSKFAELTMKDSNELHAVCLDTYPPISYLTDVSRDVMRMVHTINEHCNQTKVCYTFDAGPNACLYLLQKDVPLVLAAIKHFFPPKDENFVRGLPIEEISLEQDFVDHIPLTTNPGAIQYVISTKVGTGPQVLPSDDILIGSNGLPKHLKTAQKRKIDVVL